MESEAYFLHACYELFREEEVNKDKKLVISTKPIIRRVCIRRPKSSRTAFSRMAVDFEPIQEKAAYVVYLLPEINLPDHIAREGVYFAGIFDSQEEAQKKVYSLERGEFRSHLAKGEALFEIRTEPVLITQA